MREEGRAAMCKKMEELIREITIEDNLKYAKEVYQKCIDEGLTSEQAKRISDIDKAEGEYARSYVKS
ncbi:MAG: hypothetical protein K5739_09085 [Lachnospiraceae bacterium]|nr:hypothetical protein [Lachnospiraceae bacterium]